MLNIDNLLNIKTNNITPEKGKILISEPFLGDYYFKRSVVLLAEHNEEGSFGLIINKPIEAKFNEVVQGFPEFDIPLYLGGPVQNNSLFYIHKLGEEIEESTEIMPGLFWGGDIEVIKEMITLRQISKDDIRFYIGYSGWASKQLDGELEKNSWLVSRIPIEMIFKIHPDELWSKTVHDMGKAYRYWANLPADPGLN